ncbi:MAG: ankyrin repeat domain-containing protein [candidate division Zixibacteria bacterium]|nr:ankyrin repeat domain-containing protein [candidate division Zixibacteria bacterium]
MGALHDAANGGDIAKLKSLLDSGEDINNLDDTEGAAIHYACDKGHYDIVKELIKCGADLEIYSDEWDVPLTIAVAEGYTRISKLLIENFNDIDSEYGQRLICFAASSGNLETLKYVLSVCGPVDIEKCRPFYTPLHWAAQENHPEIVKYLLDLDIDVNSVDEQGRTPLFASMAKDDCAAMKVLIANGADVNFRTEESKDNCLQLAAVLNLLDFVNLLLDSGADINILDAKDRTALMPAVDHENIEMIKLLIERGADMTIKNYKGKTAVDYARSEKIRELLK